MRLGGLPSWDPCILWQFQGLEPLSIRQFLVFPFPDMPRDQSNRYQSLKPRPSELKRTVVWRNFKHLKGQLISKWLFGVFNFPKKTMPNLMNLCLRNSWKMALPIFTQLKILLRSASASWLSLFTDICTYQTRQHWQIWC